LHCKFFFSILSAVNTLSCKIAFFLSANFPDGHGMRGGGVVVLILERFLIQFEWSNSLLTVLLLNLARLKRFGAISLGEVSLSHLAS
jgi:hypothetical protein